MARVVVAVLATMLAVIVLLVRLPDGWVELAAGSPDAVRAVLAGVALWLLLWIRALLYSRLPKSAYLFRRTLAFRERGERRRVDVGDIAEIHVEVRPPPMHQVFTIELRDGSVHDVCPVDWPGAGRMYAKLAKKVARAKRRRGGG